MSARLRTSCPVCELAVAVPAGLAGDPSRAVLVCPQCEHRWPPDLQAGASGGSDVCRDHPARAVAWICDECDEGWCVDCDEGERAQTVGELRLSSCCMARRVPVADVERVRPFWEDLAGVLAWPLRRAGLPMLLIFWLGNFVPLLSWLIMLVLAAYLQHVLRVSARGAPHLPPFPDFDDVVRDVLYPLGRFAAVTAVLWFPLWFYRVFLGHGSPVVEVLLALPAAALWPFAVTAASVGRSLRVLLEPSTLISVLARIRLDYAVLLTLLASLLLPVGILDRFSEYTVAALAGSLLRFYALFAGFHAMGLMVRQTRNVVDWEV